MNELELQQKSMEQQLEIGKMNLRMRCLEIASGRNMQLDAEKSQHSPDEIIEESQQYSDFVMFVGTHTKAKK